VSQPKHIVLTVRNSASVTSQSIRSLKAAWNKLRRSTLARVWRGGCYSIEVTNEGRGWHIHLHALVDCPYVDQSALARKWAALVGQDFSIVYVRSATSRDYLKEVCKYACKPQDMAAWSPADIVAWLDASASLRLFGVFGSLLGRRGAWADWLKANLPKTPACECGCMALRFLSPAEYDALFLGPPGGTAPRPPPRPTTEPDTQLSLLAAMPSV
jgi:hypothetical protein